MFLPCLHGAVPQFEEINVERFGLHSLLLSRASLYLSASIKPDIQMWMLSSLTSARLSTQSPITSSEVSLGSVGYVSGQ